jgi:hypothetical protein
VSAAGRPRPRPWARSAFTAALALLLVFAAGCRTVVWFGHDQSRQRFLEIERSRSGQRVLVDGAPGPSFDGVAPGGLVQGANGRLAYPARRGAAWHLVDGGRVGSAWEGIGEVAMAAGGVALAYTAERSGRWRVVRDGVEGPDFETVLAGSLSWDLDGRHLAYAAVEAGAVRVVADGVAGPPFDGVAGLRVASDGRVAYRARRGELPSVVIGEQVRAAGEAADLLALAPRGGLAAWAERRDGRWWVVVDGLDVAEGDEILAVAADGQRWGAILRRGGRCLVLVDGAEVGEEPEAEDLQLAGPHVAWLARRPGGQAVVVDGVARRFDVLVEGTLVLGEDGRWAVVAGDAGARRVELLVDGLPVERFDFAEAALAADPGTGTARAWAAAALARERAAGH